MAHLTTCLDKMKMASSPIRVRALLFAFICVSFKFDKFIVCDYLYPNPTLPEIIINKNPNPNNVAPAGYFYPVPAVPLPLPLPITTLPPLQEEEIPSIPSIPQFDPPSNSYLPPNAYLPPANDLLPPQNDYLPAVTPFSQVNFHVKVLSMACLDSPQSQTRFFKATILMPSDTVSHPVLPKTSNCHITRHASETSAYVINLEGFKVGDCGVRYCPDKKMCLTLRIPTISGVKLPEDRLVHLQCVPQSNTASVVRTLALKTPSQTNARSVANANPALASVATGGSQRVFEPHVAIYRRRRNTNSDVFDQLVEANSAVILGEELLLKTTVKEADGWKFSRMGSVVVQPIVQHSNANGHNSRAITLIDQNGCRVDDMKSICPENPRQLNNLISSVPFRAFLFQEESDASMQLSVRLFGCMQYEDCQATRCEEKATGRNNVFASGRRKRDEFGIKNATIMHGHAVGVQDYSLAFRVRMPQEYININVQKQKQSYLMHLLAVGGLISISIGLIALALAGLNTVNHRRG